MQPELNQPRSYAQAADLAEICSRDVFESDRSKTSTSRIGELRVVERIVEIGPKLNSNSLGDVRILRKRDIPVELAWAEYDTDSRIAPPSN